MEVTVKYYASHDMYRLQEQTLDLPEKATVKDVLQTMKLGPEEATAVFWNGNSTVYSQPLKQGDVVTIMPFASGG
jgi:sulfur carrier protein ThiS